MGQHPPIIIIAMHRSGTSMVTRALEELGLFMGWRKDVNDESLFFMRLNDWLLDQTGHGWDRPPEVGKWPAAEGMAEKFESTLRAALSGLRSAEYWGPARVFQRWVSHDHRVEWGWKDPRNTVTLPVWLRIFPDAKVVHIRRHGLDVANSLQTRNEMLKRQRKDRKWQPRYRPWAMRRSWISERCTSVSEGVNLWDAYLRHAESHMRQLGDRGIDLKYETFLESPETEIRHLAEFCGLRRDDAAIGALCSKIKRKRAYAFRRDPGLAILEATLANTLSVHGYQSPTSELHGDSAG